MNTKHGVLMAEHSAVEEWSVGIREGNILFHTPVQGLITLHKLCTVCVELKLTHLWILPEYEAYDIWNTHNSFFLDADNIDWNLKHTWELGPEELGDENHLRSVYGWSRAGDDRHAFYIIFCGPWSAWKWARRHDLTAGQVLHMTSALERDLEIPITSSPGNTGKKYLERLHPKHQEWFNPPDMDLTQLPFSQAAKPLVWTRQPTNEELSRKYLIKIDKNSAYPRAGVEYMFGTGTPEHLGEVYAERTYISNKGRIPGIWQIMARPPAVEFDGEPDPDLMPSPLWHETSWVVTPVLKHLIDQGWNVDILLAWVFKDSFHIFAGWAANLWAIRLKYQEGDARRDAIKQILTDTVGLYRSAKLEEEGGVFRRRPDWYAQIVGGTRATMLQNVESFWKKHGLYPVLVHIDCILYCTDQPIGELFPDEREKLGWFKHVWQLEMSDEVRTILASNHNSAGKLKRLNPLAGEIDDGS